MESASRNSNTLLQSISAPNGGRLLPNRTPFNKDYLPGYTGHIPYKKEIYGCTLGDINKIVMGKPTNKVSNFDVDDHVSSQQILTSVGSQVLNQAGSSQPPPPYGQRTLYSQKPARDEEGIALQYTNVSMKGENWIGGPTVNKRAQHVPGYQGYVPSIKAENLYGQTYGKSTSNAINGDFPRDPGVGKPPIGSGVDRYKTQNKADYTKENFRRIRNDQYEPADIIDKIDQMNLQDEEFQGIQVAKPNIYQTIQTVGYQGFKSSYRDPIVTTYHRKQPQFNMNALKPRLTPAASATLIASTETSQQTFATIANVSEGFQKTIADSNSRLSGYNDPEKKVIPVVGYTGHRMGNRAQGFFGKNYRDCTIQSRNIQKAFQSSSVNNGGSFSSLATH